jgi:alpha 1,2-mannosyltransferase
MYRLFARCKSRQTFLVHIVASDAAFRTQSATRIVASMTIRHRHRRRRSLCQRYLFANIVALSFALSFWASRKIARWLVPATAVWVETHGCHAYGKPISIRGKHRHLPRRSFDPKSGFCLCRRSHDGFAWSTAHRGCPKFPVDCANECATSDVPPPPHDGVKRSRRWLHRFDATRRRAKCVETSIQPEIRRLFEKIETATMTPKMPVRSLPNLRKIITTDFVASGVRIPIIHRLRLRERVDTFLRDAPSANGAFRGRGIVIVGSASNAKYSTAYWIALHSLRRTGACALPVEIWFPKGELPTCEQAKSMRALGATPRSFERSFERLAKNRFAYKLLAVAMSEFDQVLYMDADNIALTANVCRLFDTSEDYARTGALLWQDFWSSSAAPDLFDVLPSSPALDFNGTHESGQFLVHKSRVWRALALALFMNAYPEIFSPLSGNYMGWGDKEFLASALAATKTPFARVSRLPQHVGVAVHDRISIWGNAMLQFDDADVPLFLHANVGKIVARDFPCANVSAYVHRWTSHADVLARATNTRDFELDWLVDTACSVVRTVSDDDHTDVAFARAPLLDGMHLADHPGALGK